MEMNIYLHIEMWERRKARNYFAVDISAVPLEKCACQYMKDQKGRLQRASETCSGLITSVGLIVPLQPGPAEPASVLSQVDPS